MARLYVSAADHPCLLKGGRFPGDQVERIGVDGNGLLDLDALDARARRATTRPTACRWSRSMLANNETGVIQPVARDRRRSSRRRAACSSSTRCRRRAAFRSILQTAYARFPDPVVAQDRRPEGRRRDRRRGRPDDADAADHRRRPGKGPSRRHRKSRRHRRLRRGGAEAHARARRACRRGAARCATRIEAIVMALAPDAEIFGAGAERLANTSFFAIPGLKAETGADRLRSRRRRAVGRLGLLVGQGRPEPCAEGDGSWRQCGRACAFRSGHATTTPRYRTVRRGAGRDRWRGATGGRRPPERRLRRNADRCSFGPMLAAQPGEFPVADALYEAYAACAVP